MQFSITMRPLRERWTFLKAVSAAAGGKSGRKREENEGPLLSCETECGVRWAVYRNGAGRKKGSTALICSLVLLIPHN